MAQELGHEPDNDLATRTGEFAMAIYSVGRYMAFTLLNTY
jgi:solute carrier family 45, member 1/2/4